MMLAQTTMMQWRDIICETLYVRQLKYLIKITKGVIK